ncbi:MAG: hypothetical protein ACYC6Y_18715 [Thermoguttaceae bacterium]
MSFLQRAVDGLTDGDKVIPVRLALFAEMVMDKAWNLYMCSDATAAGTHRSQFSHFYR